MWMAFVEMKDKKLYFNSVQKNQFFHSSKSFPNTGSVVCTSLASACVVAVALGGCPKWPVFLSIAPYRFWIQCSVPLLHSLVLLQVRWVVAQNGQFFCPLRPIVSEYRLCTSFASACVVAGALGGCPEWTATDVTSTRTDVIRRWACILPLSDNPLSSYSWNS